MTQQLQRRFSSLTVLLSFSVVQARGQSASAMMCGQVIDETGGVLPGASITVRDAAAANAPHQRRGGALCHCRADTEWPYMLTVTLSGFDTPRARPCRQMGRCR